MSPPDHYAVLQVMPDAHPEVIRAAYRALAAKFHPDAYPGPDAHERMVRINLAYEILSVAERRRAHDAEMAAAGVAGHAPTQRDRCPTCGIAVGWLENRCRICVPERTLNAEATRGRGQVRLASEWHLRVDLPLGDAMALLMNAMQRCGLAPVAVQGDSSDGRLEASLALGESTREGDSGSVSGGLWCVGASATAVRLSVAGTMSLDASEGGRPRQVLDWWMHHLALEVEHCLDHPPRSWRTGR